MPARWSAERVRALAPDDASARAAVALARPGPWGGTGACGDLVWGLCAGSGKTPYQAIVDLSGPAYRCSCPSRKFPCKHSLGLLLLWAGWTVPDAPEPADYALAWLESRREKASKSLSRTEQGGSGTAADPGTGRTGADDSGAGRSGAGGAGAGADGVAADDAGEVAGDAAGKDGSGSARRAAERAQRVAGGLAELVEWLHDQVRMGLAASVSTAGPGGSPEGGGHAEAIAARMVDAQAPGVAGVLRGLSAVPEYGDGWPARLPDPAGPASAVAPWYLVDQTGAAVVLAEEGSLWKLLAVSAGEPVTVAGEWHGQTLLPLTVWHHDEAVPL